MALIYDHGYPEMAPFAKTFEKGYNFANVNTEKKYLVEKIPTAEPTFPCHSIYQIFDM